MVFATFSFHILGRDAGCMVQDEVSSHSAGVGM